MTATVDNDRSAVGAAPLVIRAQHTPNDWAVNEEELYYLRDADITVGQVDEGRFREICLIFQDHIDRKEALANARLIAAAPEMLKALQKIVERTQCRGTANDGINLKTIRIIARGALAKIEA